MKTDSLSARSGRLLLALAALFLTLPGHADLSETIARVKPSIVAVGTVMPLRNPRAHFRGTGFVVGDGRHVITNAHVIPDKLDYKGKEELAVYTRKGEKVQGRRAEVVAKDVKHDLCLLSIRGRPLPAMKLGRSEEVKEGELYGFTGFPIGMVLGLHPVTHRGIVSAITPIAIPSISGRQLSKKMIKAHNDPYKVFQLDATAYPGNSGSPLYDMQTGRVVGVINSVLVKGTKESALERPTGISYAIPEKYLRRLLKRAGLSLNPSR